MRGHRERGRDGGVGRGGAAGERHQQPPIAIHGAGVAVILQPGVGSVTSATPTLTGRKGTETPPPGPPLHPPDYIALHSANDLEKDIAYQVHIFGCIQSKAH